MQIQRIQNYYSTNKSINYNKTQNMTNINNICFQAANQCLTTITIDSFRKEGAKKIYSKIQRYLKLLGNSGKIENVKIMRDKWSYFVFNTNKTVDNEADLLLSINKNFDKTHINLSRKSSDKSKATTVLDAFFNKNGQMVHGNFTPVHIRFERTGANVRRMTHNGKQYLPAGNNDKEWGILGYHIGSTASKDNVYTRTILDEDNSAGGIYDIFLEFARLKTSIL